MVWNRREFLGGVCRAGRYAVALATMPGLGWTPVYGLTGKRSASLARGLGAAKGATGEAFDAEVMKSLAEWTSLTLETPSPNPFGCEIVDTKTGERLMRALNAVGPENDPSAHAEVRTMRLACNKLKSPSLRGHTLYTTCEPCPMCMANALWAGVDRVVYGATIADANRFCQQIQIPAAEVAQRSDMTCVVDGPVQHELCLAIFTHPKMQATFKQWAKARKS